jgi:anti-sigma B factor antagonist
MPTEGSAPQLTLDIERQGTTTLVRLHGKLVLGVTDALYASVGRLIPESKRIILDLTDLSAMDSIGLRSQGCTVELINIGKRIRDLLELTHIWEIFSKVGEHGIRF